MAKTIDILTVIDPLGLPDNLQHLRNPPLSTPIQDIPMLSIADLRKYVWMIGENDSVVENQASWNLHIKASQLDQIRWWDVTVVQDTMTDVIIIDFAVSSNWSSVLDQPTAHVKLDAIAYIENGFQLGNISNLEFTMATLRNNYITAQVKENAQLGTIVNYTLTVAKLDIRGVQAPPVKALYRFDPTITIVR